MSSFKKRVAILLVVAMTVLSCVPGYAEIPENQNGEVPGNEIELATPQEIASPSEEIEENEIVEPAEPEVLEEKALGENFLEEEEMLTSDEDDIETWAELQARFQAQVLQLFH